MKNSTLIFFLILCYFLQINRTNAQWQQFTNYEGGRSFTIERKGDKIWLGTSSGLFFSSDEGANWEETPEINNQIINNISYFGDTLIILYSTNLSFGYQLFSRTSYDDGNTWNSEAIVAQTVYPLSNKTVIEKIKGKLYLLYGFDQNYVSDDNGQHWKIFSQISTEENHHEIIAHTSEGFILKTYTQPPTFECLFYDPLTEQTQPFNVDFTLQSMFTHKDKIFALGRTNNKSTIYKTEDLSQSWDSLYSTDLPISSHDVPFIDGDNIYISSFISYIVSYDGGDSWKSEPEAPEFINFIDFVRTKSAEYLVVDHINSVIKYTPDLNNYSPSGSGINNKSVKNIFQNKGRIFTINFGGNNMSSDGGQTWNNILEGHRFIEGVCFKGDTVVFIEKYDDPVLIISYDNGDNWLIRDLNINLGNPYFLSVAIMDNTLFINTDDFIMESHDMGISWEALKSLPAQFSSSCLPNSDGSGIVQVIEDKLFAVTNSGYVFQYEPQTKNWKYILCNWSPGAFQDNRIFNVGETYCALIDDIFISDDGVNFTKAAGLGRPTSSWGNPTDIISITEVDDIWYASFEESGIYYSKNKGDHWFQLDAKPPFIADGGLINYNGKLIAGSSYSGLWERNIHSNISKGYVYFDISGNGIEDVEDYALGNFNIKLSNSGSYISTDQNGNFEMPLISLSDTLSASLPNEFYQSFPSYYIVSGGEENLIFGIHLPQNAKNVYSDINNISNFYPGNVSIIEATAGNLGSQETSVLLKVMLDPATTLASADPTNYTLSGDTVIWRSESLKFGQTSKLKLFLNINEDVADGDSLIFRSISYELDDDIEPSNNYSIIKPLVENNFPENEKFCLQGERMFPDEILNKKEIQYVINFQNKGDDTVKNVRINDLLDSNLDPSTFRLISQSHPMRLVMSENGMVDFYFDGINLESSTLSDNNSRGYVKYGVRVRPGLIINSSIENTALLYFDEEDYISTNTVITYVVDPPLGIHKINSEKLQKVHVYPNPAVHGISLDFTNMNGDQYSVKIIDALGKKIKSTSVSRSNNYIELNGISTGMYIGLIMDHLGNHIGNFKFIHN